MKIGSTKLHQGLYILTPLNPKHYPLINNFVFHYSSILVDSCNMWNNRLGHPSHDNLVQINKKLPMLHLTCTFTPCDVCLYAKHRWLPFNNSKNCSTKCFDLVHMDIQGQLSTPSMLGFCYFLTITDDHSR